MTRDDGVMSMAGLTSWADRDAGYMSTKGYKFRTDKFDA